jgi:hypothetical protein
MNSEPDWKPTAASIPVQLDHDPHLADSSLARAGGPDATLACAECGRAKWMHDTRHDTCGQFCWITAGELTVQQIETLETAPGLRQACAVAINLAKRGALPPMNLSHSKSR